MMERRFYEFGPFRLDANCLMSLADRVRSRYGRHGME